MGFPFPPGADEDTPMFVISVAAELAGLHAQTLRGYDRMGLVSPGRTSGGGRRYSMRDIAVLREVQRLSQEQGVNLAGVKRIIELENETSALRSRVAELTEELAAVHAAAEQAAAAIHRSYRNELVPVRQQTALVVWKPRQR
ncbi:heat shock protein transcriptional repressor HspR [Actinophytocola sediminis]